MVQSVQNRIAGAKLIKIGHYSISFEKFLSKYSLFAVFVATFVVCGGGARHDSSDVTACAMIWKAR